MAFCGWAVTKPPHFLLPPNTSSLARFHISHLTFPEPHTTPTVLPLTQVAMTGDQKFHFTNLNLRSGRWYPLFFKLNALWYKVFIITESFISRPIIPKFDLNLGFDVLHFYFMHWMITFLRQNNSIVESHIHDLTNWMGDTTTYSFYSRWFQKVESHFSNGYNWWGNM